MSANSCSMDCRPFFHRGVAAAKDPALDLLNSGEEEEDSDFYAELWQQILQLTSDEDENRVSTTNEGPWPVIVPSPVGCSGWQMNTGNIEPSPVWWLSPPRSGSGTGVFIPSIAGTERRDRRVRAARKKKKASKKQVENK